jgi:predicted transcriptional regulator of viral defense system
MRLIDAEQKILQLKQPVLQTRNVSNCLNITTARANQILVSLVKVGRFTRLMRGRWATTTQIDPLILPEYLTLPFPSYVSLQTALFFHGMISQIPHIIYAASLARTKKYTTPLATVSIHHIQADFFFGFEMQGHIKMATPEKALIDTFYLTAARSRLFKTLPEIELPKTFNIKKAISIIEQIKSPRTRTLVETRLNKLL